MQCLLELDANDKVEEYFRKICQTLFHTNKFDWRTASFPDFKNDVEKITIQSSFRGSGGYALLYNRCLDLLIASDNQNVHDAALEVKGRR